MMLGLYQVRGAQSITLTSEYNMKDFQKGFNLTEAPKSVTIIGTRDGGGYFEVMFSNRTVKAEFEYLHIDQLQHSFFVGQLVSSAFTVPAIKGFVWVYMPESKPKSIEVVSNKYVLLP